MYQEEIKRKKKIALAISSHGNLGGEMRLEACNFTNINTPPLHGCFSRF